MNAAVFAYSRQGCRTARKIREFFPGAELRMFTMARFEEPGFEALGRKDFYGELFGWADALVFVSSCGIAVREIAPYIRSKLTDPAVVVTDELGRFVIPLLSGHIGGANDLARDLAAWLGSIPVVTTATDINRKFSVDSWAARKGLILSSMTAAKAVSAAILEGDVPLCSDFPLTGAFPPGVTAGDTGPVGICLSCRTAEPFGKTLRLIPRILHLGLGCRRGTGESAIAEAVELALQKCGIDRRAICCAASIDLKAEEPGLLEYCRNRNLPVTFYPAETLARVPGNFTASSFVAKVTGVDNVCERSALVGAHRLILRKFPHNGVTVAVAAENWEVEFG